MIVDVDQDRNDGTSPLHFADKSRRYARHRTAPDRVPLPQPLPVRSSRSGENFGPASTDRCVAPPSPTQFVGEGRGGGRPTIPHHSIRTPRLPAPTQPPPAVSGEVGRWCRPGGGLRGLSEALQILPQPQPPPVFFGGGASLSERRGRAPRAGPSEALAPLPHTQPPPVFFGGGGRVVRARRGRPLAGTVRSALRLTRCPGAPGAGTPRGCPGRPGTRPSWRW